jgi:hypothetical protein
MKRGREKGEKHRRNKKKGDGKRVKKKEERG